MNDLKPEDLEKTNFQDEIKEFVKKKILNKSEYKLLISQDKAVNYSFKEQLVRTYFVFIFQNTMFIKMSKNEIINIIKDSYVYKLFNNTNKYESPINYLYDKLEQEASLLIMDEPDYMVECEHDYQLYDLLKIKNLNYKESLDIYLYCVLNWIYTNDVRELELYGEQLSEYFNTFKSRDKVFENLTLALQIKKQIKDLLTENIDENEDFYVKLLKKVSENLDVNEIKSLEENIFLDYNLDMNSIKKQNSHWYEWIINGQYMYDKIPNFPGFTDYSIVIASWCKCTESILYDKLYSKIEHLNNSIIQNKMKINKQKVYTLGSLPWLCKKNSNDFDDKIIEMLNKEFRYGSNDEFKDLIHSIDILNDKYRIKADHRFETNYIMAEECREIIFITAKIIKNVLEKIK